MSFATKVSVGFDSSAIPPVSGSVNEGTNSFAVARISPWREFPLYGTPEGFTGAEDTFGLTGAVMGWVRFPENPGGGTDGFEARGMTSLDDTDIHLLLPMEDTVLSSSMAKKLVTGNCSVEVVVVGVVEFVALGAAFCGPESLGNAWEGVLLVATGGTPHLFPVFAGAFIPGIVFDARATAGATGIVDVL